MCAEPGMDLRTAGEFHVCPNRKTFQPGGGKSVYMRGGEVKITKKKTEGFEFIIRAKVSFSNNTTLGKIYFSYPFFFLNITTAI